MKTIAVDIDDVLAANAEGFVDFSNKRWGTSLSPEDYTEHWAELWQLDFKAVLKRRSIIFNEKVHYNHRPITDAKPVLQKLSKRHKLVVISSRNKEIMKESLDWINKEFPGIFSEVHFSGIYDNVDKNLDKQGVDALVNSTKVEIASEIGADYLIDDQPKHCVAVARAGIKTILFGDYSWNRNIKPRKNMVKAKTWAEVETYFDAESRRAVQR